MIEERVCRCGSHFWVDPDRGREKSRTQCSACRGSASRRARVSQGKQVVRRDDPRPAGNYGRSAMEDDVRRTKDGNAVADRVLNSLREPA